MILFELIYPGFWLRIHIVRSSHFQMTVTIFGGFDRTLFFRVFVMYFVRARRNEAVYNAFNWSGFVFTSLWLGILVV